MEQKEMGEGGKGKAKMVEWDRASEERAMMAKVAGEGTGMMKGEITRETAKGIQSLGKERRWGQLFRGKITTEVLY